MRTLLLTNDDGIAADGLIRLAEAARAFGEVWIVAPDCERSATSHAITLSQGIDIYPYAFPVEGVRAFSCSGMPGDCVRVGIQAVMPKKPDAVLSGINYGYNVANDIQYSATVGAAFEAALWDCLGVALSEESSSSHEVSAVYLKELLRMALEEQAKPDRIININFPGCRLKDCKGILTDRRVSGHMVFDDRYEAIEKLPGEGKRYRVKGVPRCESEEGTDLRAVQEGYISYGPVYNIR